MGRARGRKGDHWPPELRDLQRRGGMSPDWHEAAHRRGGGVGNFLATQEKVSQVFALSGEEIRSLKGEPWSGWRIREIFAKVRQENLHLLDTDDPLVQALWEQERLRIQRWLEPSPMQLFWKGSFDPDWKRVEDFWKARLVDDVTSTQGNPDYISWSLTHALLREDSAEEILQSKDRRVLRECLENLSADPDLWKQTARGDLLFAYAQGSIYHPFWLQTGGLPGQVDFSKALLQSWLPSGGEDFWNLLESRLQSLDFHEGEKGIFHSTLLHEVAEKIVESGDENFYPAGDKVFEGRVRSAAFRNASFIAVKEFFNRLASREDFDDRMSAICGDRWPALRSSLLDRLKEYEEDPEKLQGWVADILYDKFVGSAADKIIEGDRSIGDFVSSQLEGVS